MEGVISHERVDRSIETFNNILTPDIQRTITRSAVNQIIETQLRQYEISGKYLIVGTIAIARVNNLEYILDGQHRLTAFVELSRMFPERPITITCDYFVMTNMHSAEAFYKTVNTQIWNPIAVLAISETLLTQRVVKFFTDKFPSQIKETASPAAPNLSVKLITEAFHDKKIFSCEWTSAEMLIEYIIRLNAFYSSCTQDQLINQWKANAKSMTKATGSEKLFLGMYRAYEWVDRLIDMFNAKGVIPAHHYSVSCRPRRPSTQLREDVWKHYSGHNGNHNKLLAGKCYCCGFEIMNKSFQCGHITAFYYGGKTTLENLRPVCASCNLDMGTMHMEEYKKIRVLEKSTCN